MSCSVVDKPRCGQIADAKIINCKTLAGGRSVAERINLESRANYCAIGFPNRHPFDKHETRRPWESSRLESSIRGNVWDPHRVSRAVIDQNVAGKICVEPGRESQRSRYNRDRDQVRCQTYRRDKTETRFPTGSSAAYDAVGNARLRYKYICCPAIEIPVHVPFSEAPCNSSAAGLFDGSTMILLAPLTIAPAVRKFPMRGRIRINRRATGARNRKILRRCKSLPAQDSLRRCLC